MSHRAFCGLEAFNGAPGPFVRLNSLSLPSPPPCDPTNLSSFLHLLKWDVAAKLIQTVVVWLVVLVVLWRLLLLLPLRMGLVRMGRIMG